MRDQHDEPALAGYEAPAWLPGGHMQTIVPALRGHAEARYRRERVDTPDGDFWDFDWLAAPAAPDAPLVVLFHGLEGGSGSHYARSLMRQLAIHNYRGVVPHFRGCSGEPNRRPRAYHSGDHAEIAAMLTAIRTRVSASTSIYAFGVSLGASALLNWLGRPGYDAGSLVIAAAAVSAPLDLMAAGIAIGKGANRIYTQNFLNSLLPKARAMAKRYPGLIDEGRLEQVRSMWAFDDTVTAPLHGFAGVEDYWTRGSSKPWLAGVTVPTLVLNAQNDPFIPAGSLPGREEVSIGVMLEQPPQGGHGGFMTGPIPGQLDWLPQRVLSFFAQQR